ncbi:cytochrome C oxidase subunit IV family protein [Sphaerobacter sp.]|uniref:cytochrome C oxidase subunit IV family protein n=1 Tax=Sphaerobacter sp. TaxID=2099654 RepID=UPI001DC6EF98|nr:cytochrome C oxidase subunit IV family protein [Sphaerobacter sp.]MBX5443721.1 cytochrome C oxidase subunit IV family protein [Sphaerobacter sp.]
MSHPGGETSVEHAHPGAITYVKVAAILAILTITEVSVYYIPALMTIITPVLIVLSIAKFLLVVAFYMHLKFDSRLFTGIFAWGMFVAIAIVLAMIALYAY